MKVKYGRCQIFPVDLRNYDRTVCPITIKSGTVTHDGRVVFPRVSNVESQGGREPVPLNFWDLLHECTWYEKQ